MRACACACACAARSGVCDAHDCVTVQVVVVEATQCKAHPLAPPDTRRRCAARWARKRTCVRPHLADERAHQTFDIGCFEWGLISPVLFGASTRHHCLNASNPCFPSLPPAAGPIAAAAAEHRTAGPVLRPRGGGIALCANPGRRSHPRRRCSRACCGLVQLGQWRRAHVCVCVCACACVRACVRAKSERAVHPVLQGYGRTVKWDRVRRDRCTALRGSSGRRPASTPMCAAGPVCGARQAALHQGGVVSVVAVGDGIRGGWLRWRAPDRGRRRPRPGGV